MFLYQVGSGEAFDRWRCLFDNPPKEILHSCHFGLARLFFSKEQNMTKRNKGKKARGFKIIQQHVAGIDLGSVEHWVCCPPSGENDPNVKFFPTNTASLQALSAWLKKEGITSVAMESTGVYWIPIYEILDRNGFEVLLVDTRFLSRVPGRKTDMIDCQWIQLLHSCGLLSGAFRPPKEVCELRSYVRAHANFVSEASDWLRRMQKELDQMNVRVHRAVSDISGTTGMSIIRAIVDGERDPKRLAALRHPNCRLSEEQIAEELTGTWHTDHLFNLAQCLSTYDFFQERIAEYERKILSKIEAMKLPDADLPRLDPPKNKNKAQKIKQHGQGPMREALYAMSGVDLTSIDGINVNTAQVILSEIGPDISSFSSEKQFKRFATLAPNIIASGGKSKRGKRKGMTSNRLGQAFRMAAVSQQNSQSALGAYFRRISKRKGYTVAIFATAGKISQIVFRMLRYGQEYVDIGAKAYEERFRERRIRALKQSAQELGFKVLPNQMYGSATT